MLTVNSVCFSGRATEDAKLKEVGASKVCTIRLAQNESVKRKGSEEAEKKTTYIDAEAWGQQAEFADKFVKKGSIVLIMGKLEQDNWETEDGTKRSKHKLYVRELKVDNFEGKPAADGKSAPVTKGSKKNSEDGEDLPF